MNEVRIPKKKIIWINPQAKDDEDVIFMICGFVQCKEINMGTLADLRLLYPNFEFIITEGRWQIDDKMIPYIDKEWLNGLLASINMGLYKELAGLDEMEEEAYQEALYTHDYEIMTTSLVDQLFVALFNKLDLFSNIKPKAKKQCYEFLCVSEFYQNALGNLFYVQHSIELPTPEAIEKYAEDYIKDSNINTYNSVLDLYDSLQKKVPDDIVELWSRQEYLIEEFLENVYLNKYYFYFKTAGAYHAKIMQIMMFVIWYGAVLSDDKQSADYSKIIDFIFSYNANVQRFKTTSSPIIIVPWKDKGILKKYKEYFDKGLEMIDKEGVYVQDDTE
ncbi:hypothetical protein [Mycoplasma seminis]|uniref:Uncharacterized protein n=1 Tax=Mycoplasma seminis TaxID=512749 RepID=A0ABY9HAL7_9MOLU|nr:hypothetical protein [Mycoplasma seminis]WLP85652.1 hypothetical protein Q8852_00625 [Mycoplasma seminis]